MTTTIDQHENAFGREVTLQELADRVGGRLLAVPGADPERLDNEKCCKGATTPWEAGLCEITMVDEIKNIETLVDCSALAVVTPFELTQASLDETPVTGIVWQIVVVDVHAAFTELVAYFRPAKNGLVPGAGIASTAKVHPTAHVSPTANIGDDVEIGPGCQIHAGVTIGAGSSIGADCILHPGVVLYSYCKLANRVSIHSGSVIGAHGFGYQLIDGKHIATAQLGYVSIESDVDIGACVTIDRGTYGATRIGEGTKIDNHVQIAHNCRIGRHNLICSQVGIAGSCSTGDYVILAGQVGLKDHLDIADECIIAAQSGVMDNLGKGVFMGSPAMPIREQMQVYAGERKLPEMRRELRAMRKEMTALRDQISSRRSDEETSTSSKAA